MSIARNAESGGCFSTTSPCGYSSCLGGELVVYDILGFRLFI